MAIRARYAIGAAALGLVLLPQAFAERQAPRQPTIDLRVTAHDTAMPDDTVLLEQLHDAIELRRREDFDRVLDARDPGELIEHATLTEMMFERSPIAIDTLF